MTDLQMDTTLEEPADFNKQNCCYLCLQRPDICENRLPVHNALLTVNEVDGTFANLYVDVILTL